jgi:hypothetical protein
VGTDELVHQGIRNYGDSALIFTGLIECIVTVFPRLARMMSRMTGPAKALDLAVPSTLLTEIDAPAVFIHGVIDLMFAA